jgi:RimJ/RimL family protein N-acetyltransferase
VTAPLLRTRRLILREIGPNDVDAVHAYASDPEVVQYVPWGPNTEQVTLDFVQRCMERAMAEPRLEYVFGVVPRESVDLIGSVGLYLASEESHQAMLGYAYGRPAWGQGYATEAALAMMELGFDVLGLQRIWASCDPDNHGSAHVLEKVGMKLEGHFRESCVIRGSLRDQLYWGILEREWAERTNHEEHGR